MESGDRGKGRAVGNGQPAPGHACGFCDFKGRSGRGNGQTGSCIYHGKGNESTVAALREEQFHLIEMDFRPTAENFAKYFYEKMQLHGYRVKCATVYETPNNSATYCED